MAWQKPQHLAEVVEEHGTGSASAAIVKLIKHGIEKKRAANDAQRVADGKELKVNPYVTDAGKCPRQVYKSLVNEPPTNPITVDSEINFAVGHAVEEAFASLLELSGAEIAQEVRIEIPVADTVVSGRVDFLISVPRDLLKELGLVKEVGGLPEHCLIELKSSSSRNLGWMLRNGQAGSDNYRRQINQYLHASQLGQLDRKYDVGFLVYIVKDATKGEPPVHAFEVKYDEQQALADLANAALIKKRADAGMEPNIPEGYTRSKFPCGYCSWQDSCWGPKAVRKGAKK